MTSVISGNNRARSVSQLGVITGNLVMPRFGKKKKKMIYLFIEFTRVLGAMEWNITAM